ncbi:ABC transporter permease [Nakamurella sp. YIM 132087]|uniref:ABC transporter permease n=1 Tax=Nakamurella alba TaxID=2665158 RepID=A0A7K1FSF5_9ACTN|nr:ABC transporter permease [Nakamurella alba]MTD17010.1 ABC transporter permease [Nakamurella alba]
MNPFSIVRLHLIDRYSLTWLTWGVLTFIFAVNFVIFTLVPPNPDANYYTGALATIYFFMVVLGAQAVGKFLPFGMALGLTRKKYYAGTALTMVILSVGHGLLLTFCTWLEGITGGWGRNIHFFRIPGFTDGPLYQVLITTVVFLVLAFLFGLWAGLIWARWKMVGVVVFTASLVLVVLAAAVLVSVRGWWPEVGRFFVNTDILAITGFSALLGLLLVAGGYTTMRKVTA